ncbi:hypothetical protein MLD38_013546 [Melastoma candidum]|uniref:Uncharacterized protein n=1 Tax=Melastoma candidum TaxID=119954 RepID=A0ACB9RDK8_9MYRT|nr:hypothetical protein MLD38_013546 [Melastoma candidum]
MEYRKLKDQEDDVDAMREDVESRAEKAHSSAGINPLSTAGGGLGDHSRWKRKSIVTLALTFLTSSQAILIVWSKRAGKYGIQKIDTKFWFHEGWQDFVCVEVQLSERRQWQVRCLYRAGRVKQSQGWYDFCLENNLAEGDVCVFELIGARDIVLKVYLFRVMDEAGMVNPRLHGGHNRKEEDIFPQNK